MTLFPVLIFGRDGLTPLADRMAKAPRGPTSPVSMTVVNHKPPPSPPKITHNFSYLPAISISQIMIKLWSTTPIDQLTPRPNYKERDPFDSLPSPIVPHRRSSPGPLTPTSVHPLLGHASPFIPPIQAGTQSVTADLTPLGTTSAQPTTHLSLHAPVFNMQPPPPGNRKRLSNISTSTNSVPPVAHSNISKGQIHVKLIQARGLNVGSLHALPYVVVQFEQNEFVSRDPTDETDKEVKGTAINVSRNASSNAISALGAIGSKAAALTASKKPAKSNSPSPSSSVSSGKSTVPSTPSTHTGPSNGLFGRLSAHNPVWKHEVSL